MAFAKETIDFTIGQKVQNIDKPVYNAGPEFIVPLNSVGRIISIRHRYVGTPCEYKQYKVHFDNIDDGDSLTHLYDCFSLILVD